MPVALPLEVVREAGVGMSASVGMGRSSQERCSSQMPRVGDLESLASLPRSRYGSGGAQPVQAVRTLVSTACVARPIVLLE